MPIYDTYNCTTHILNIIIKCIYYCMIDRSTKNIKIAYQFLQNRIQHIHRRMHCISYILFLKSENK